MSTCGSCVWRYDGGPGPKVARCRRHGGRRVAADESCPAYEAELDCLACGACCREAYHAVEVGPRDPFVKKHPDRVVPCDGRLNVKRSGSRCSCLVGDGPYACVVYDDRPRTCRDFTRGSANCVEARRRVGLTR